MPVVAHYKDNGVEVGTENTSVQFVATGDDLKNIQYDAKKGKAGDTLNSEVILDENEYERKPVKYTIDQTEYTDDKGNKIGTKKANVQFLGSGTEGKHQYTESIPFETTVEYTDDPNLKPGEWRYKVVDGKEQKGQNGSKTKEITIKNSKVEGKPETIKEEKPVNAIIEISKRDYTGTVTHTEKIGVPFEVEYKYSDELEAGQTKVEQEGKKGSYDLEYSQKIKNGEADGNATTEKKNEVEAQKKIVVIGTKPIVKEVKQGYSTEIVYDDTLEAGNWEEKTPGKDGKTTITSYYDKDQKKVITTEVTEAPTNRVVRVGTKLTENTCPAPDPEPGNPGGEEPGTPGKEDHGTPGTKDPGEPGTKDPGKSGIVEKSPDQPASNNSGTPAAKAPEKNASESTGATVVPNEDYIKAPQTSDPGVAGYMGLGGLASGLLAFLQRKKKEDDEE